MAFLFHGFAPGMVVTPLQYNCAMHNNGDAAANRISDRSRTAQQRAQLAELDALLAAAHEATAKAVVLAGALAGSGAAEAAVGLPLALHLGLSARMTARIDRC